MLLSGIHYFSSFRKGAPVADDRSHKIKKGETLTKIAKKWKHRKWQTIWDDPGNASLKKKRREADKIEPGDVLFIPYTDAEKKAIIEAKLLLYSLADVERNLAASLLKQADATSEAASVAMKRHKDATKEYNDIIAMLQKTAKDTKKMKDGVDIAWAIANLGRGLGKMAKLSRDASKASGKALEEINKQARGQAIDMMKGPVEGEAKKAGTKYLLDEKNDISMLGMVVGSISEAQDKMTSPSFWFHAYVQMKDGASWTDVVTDKWERDVKNKIYLVDKEKLFLTKKLLVQAQDAVKSAKSMQDEAKKAIKRADDIVKEIEKMPDP